MGNEWKEFIRKKYIEYKRIGYVECPAFNNENIYFNKHGFNHLIRKRGKLRLPSQQIRRVSLLPYASIILAKTTKYISYYSNTEDGHTAYFWTFHGLVDFIKVKIVIRQLGDGGKKHFFSIMDRGTKAQKTR